MQWEFSYINNKIQNGTATWKVWTFLKMTYAFNSSPSLSGSSIHLEYLPLIVMYAINLSFTFIFCLIRIHFIHCLTRSLLMIRLEDQEMASAGGILHHQLWHNAFTQATHLHHLLSLVWGSYFLHSTYFAPLFVLFLLRPVILNSRHSSETHVNLFFLNKDSRLYHVVHQILHLLG